MLKHFLLICFSVICAAAVSAETFLPEKHFSRPDKNSALKYWEISRRGKRAAAKILPSGGGIEFDSNGGLVVIYGKNFRIPAEKFSAGEVFFRAGIAGTGKVRFSFYCYGANGKFMQSLRCGEKDFADAQVTVSASEIPAKVKTLVPVLTLSGQGSINRIDCGIPGAAEFQSLLPPDFKKFPLAEKLKVVDSAPDHRIPLAVLTLKDDPADKEYQLRFRAAYKLGKLGESAAPAAEMLVKQLKHRNEAVRVHSAAALTRLGKSAYPLMKKVLIYGTLGERLCLANTLRGMPGGVPAELTEAVKWASPPHAVEVDGSQLPDSSFEASRNGALYGWDVEFRDGATGSYEIAADRAHSGRQSLKITKTNGRGYILLVSKFPVVLPPGNRKPYTFRVHYQCSDAAYNSLLLPRFLREDGSFQWHDTRFFGGAGWQGQSVLVNTATLQWGKRIIIAGSRKHEQSLRPAVVLSGNPVTVYLDDLEFPARPVQYSDSGRSYSTAGYTMPEALKEISRRPETSAQVESLPNGKCVLKLNGKTTAPVFMLSFSGALGDYEQFARAGINQPVVTVNMKSSCRYLPFRSIWANGKVDISPLFEIVEEALCKAPGTSPVLGINVAFPADYVDRNPGEAYLNEKGLRAYGTDAVVIGFAKELPKGGNYRWWPSQFSEKSRQEAGGIIRQFLTELRKKPYSKVISGFFISGGHDGQFFIPFRDHGPAATAAWRKFLQEKYRTDEALQKAWQRPDVTVSTAVIPPERDAGVLAGEYYDRQMQIDCKEFEERQIWLNSGYYLEICKEIFGRDKLGFSWCFGGTWSQNLPALYESSGRDLFAAQPQYHYRPAGYSGGLNMVADSNLLHRTLAVSELDLRSWLRGAAYPEIYGMKLGTPLSMTDMRNVILKEAGRMIAVYQGFWFYDMGNGTFRDPQCMELIKKVKKTADRVFENAGTDDFIPDTVWVTSPRSFFSTVPLGGGKRGNFASSLTEEMMWALRGSGVFSATMLLEDLKKDRRYEKFKVFVFLNPFNFSADDMRFIREKLQRNGNTLVWVNGSGIPGRSSDITGIEVEFRKEPGEMPIFKNASSTHLLLKNVPEYLGVADAFRKRFELGTADFWKHKQPRWVITDPAAEVLARYDSGEAAVAVKEHKDFRTVFCGLPGSLDPVLFHNIVRSAGGYTVTRPGAVVDMNGNFLSIHALKDGTYSITLPDKDTELECFETGRKVPADLKLAAGESRWFMIVKKTDK